MSSARVRICDRLEPGTSRPGNPMTFGAANNQPIPSARMASCPPSSQANLSRACVAPRLAAKGVGTAPQTPPRSTATPLASRLSGTYHRESWERSSREDHHQFLGLARQSSCSCHRSAFQYLPTQFAATPPCMGRGARLGGKKSSANKGRQQVSAMRPAEDGSIQATTSPTVRPTRLLTRRVRSPTEGQERSCASQAVLLTPSTRAIIASATTLTRAGGLRPRGRGHATTEGLTNQSRVQARKLLPHTRADPGMRLPASEPSVQALTRHAGTSACWSAFQASASTRIWMIEMPRLALIQQALKIRLLTTRSIVR